MLNVSYIPPLLISATFKYSIAIKFLLFVI